MWWLQTPATLPRDTLGDLSLTARPRGAVKYRERRHVMSRLVFTRGHWAKKYLTGGPGGGGECRWQVLTKTAGVPRSSRSVLLPNSTEYLIYTSYLQVYISQSSAGKLDHHKLPSIIKMLVIVAMQADMSGLTSSGSLIIE